MLCIRFFGMGRGLEPQGEGGRIGSALRGLGFEGFGFIRECAELGSECQSCPFSFSIWSRTHCG
jgi:hypothetical protein